MSEQANFVMTLVLQVVARLLPILEVALAGLVWLPSGANPDIPHKKCLIRIKFPAQVSLAAKKCAYLAVVNWYRRAAQSGLKSI